MTELTIGHVHGPDEACELAISQAQAFLHGELDDSSADEIRSHLMACESCMDNYEIEQMITTMIRRCCHAEHASSGLRARISRLSITINGPTP